jgi:hypothetical protein
MMIHEHAVGGGEVFEEHLNIFKMILDRFAKYLLLPGVNIDININGKVSQLSSYLSFDIHEPQYVTLAGCFEQRDHDHDRNTRFFQVF